MNIREKIIIKNFFSIKDFEWDIKGFNILTGGMGSGKSLALKLLYFCEQVLYRTIFSEPNLTREGLYDDKYFDTIEDIFSQFFPSRNRETDFYNTIIKYEYNLFAEKESDMLYDSQFSLFEQPVLARFDLSAEWNKESKKIKWSSIYIASCLEKWQRFFNVPNAPDLQDSVRNSIYNSIVSDFQRSFPLASMFIPASRAIAAIADTISSRDEYINRFIRLKNFALSFENISNDIVNNILRVKKITIEKNEPAFELLDGRNISSLELSSGQQELLYLLLLINDLKDTGFKYGESVSVFIEEPCAHLFPREQKETMEFLVSCFHLLQGKNDLGFGYRFFISTHSPYILNSFNNILEKGRLLKKAEEIKKMELKEEIVEKINDIPFSDLSIKDVSAYMIDDDGIVKSMINTDDEGQYIYSAVIGSIENVISADSEKLFNINDNLNEYLCEKVGVN